ncbi:hypothetical protein [Microvirus mar64]|uniref:Uncharacterized protein n=1 Tax=Microvirus mar64 TaxID=2851201 RepID=A0A8F5MJG4_9VIRU|nr:hypothetical protein [Microvirus mar64]
MFREASYTGQAPHAAALSLRSPRPAKGACRRCFAKRATPDRRPTPAVHPLRSPSAHGAASRVGISFIKAAPCARLSVNVNHINLTLFTFYIICIMRFSSISLLCKRSLLVYVYITHSFSTVNHLT